MNRRRSLATGTIVLACALLMSSARAQEPKIYLDVDDVSAGTGAQIMLSIFIDNVPDSIAAYQLALIMSRPDIAFFLPTLELAGTLTDGWGGGASLLGDHAVQITSGAGQPPFWTPIPPNTSGTLVKVALELYCDIPDTMQDRTLGIEVGMVNTVFSTPRGVMIEPLDFTSGAVIAGLRCPHQGDIEPDGFVTSIDLSAMISILFEGMGNPQDPCCSTGRFDLDCDGFPTSLDLSRVIDHLFAGGSGPCTP